MNYCPLYIHSHYSILYGLSKSSQIAEHCKKNEIKSIALVDKNSISGSIDFYKEMNESEVKPILGAEINICHEHASIKEDNVKLTSLCILAKNLKGWKNLIKLISESNKPEHFYHKPRLSLQQLSEFLTEDLIVYSGYIGSNICSTILNKEYTALQPNWLQDGINISLWFKEILKDNFYLGVQLIDCINSPIQKVVTEAVREISRNIGIPCVALPNSYYINKEDIEERYILLCSNLNTRIDSIKDVKVFLSNEIGKKSVISQTSFNLEAEFDSFKSNCHIPNYNEMIECGHTEIELQNTIGISNKIEEYEVLHNPMLPEFPCPNNLTPDQYLRELCREGWKEKIQDIIPKEEQEIYINRVKEELDTFCEAGLSSYFLVVYDICQFVINNGWLLSPGRGSAAGCLVSYLIGITGIDPISYNLLLERFWNKGRQTKDRISLPDIDLDVPVGHREEVINYIKHKYGEDKVAQIITYSTLAGRKAIKEVLRAYGKITFEDINRITRCFPDKALISGELESIKQKTGSSSLVEWTIKHKSKELEEWVKIDEDGNLSGDLAKEFEQSIKIEGVKSGSAKHAAGVLVSVKPIGEICPHVYNPKNKNQMGGFEMQEAEAVGLVKLDILGISMLDKVMGVESILKTGIINDN